MLWTILGVLGVLWLFGLIGSSGGGIFTALLVAAAVLFAGNVLVGLMLAYAKQRE